MLRYPSSERFCDKTISGKIVAIGKPFSVAGILTLKASILSYILLY